MIETVRAYYGYCVDGTPIRDLMIHRLYCNEPGCGFHANCKDMNCTKHKVNHGSKL